MPTSDKDSRQAFITEIISSKKVIDQAELMELLKAKGKDVTQTTVSRDLKEMGVYKERQINDNGYYTIPEVADPILQQEQLGRMLKEWGKSVTVSGNLIIIKTDPGSAHVVASALDKSHQPKILGTIAGDDTVFIAVKSRLSSSVALALGLELEKIAELKS